MFKYVMIILLFIPLFTFGQENVADVAHAFMKAVKHNDLKSITPFLLDLKSSSSLLPREAIALTEREKEDKYIKPLQQRFEENFKKIQDQIEEHSIDVSQMEFISYTLDAPADHADMQAMNIIFTYYKREYAIPISVIRIKEKWYLSEILFTTNIFRKETNDEKKTEE